MCIDQIHSLPSSTLLSPNFGFPYVSLVVPFFHSGLFSFLDLLTKRKYVIFVFLSLVYFAYQNDLHFHPFS
jgi:hypothetical protein